MYVWCIAGALILNRVAGIGILELSILYLVVNIFILSHKKRLRIYSSVGKGEIIFIANLYIYK